MKINSIPGFILISFVFALSACKKPVSAPGGSIQPVGNFSLAQDKQQRLDWNLKTLVAAYQEAGYTNPKWDAPAVAALKEFARLRANATDPDEDSAKIIHDNIAAAVDAGCNDPMVNYLYIRYAMDETNSKEAFDAAFLKAESGMEKSSYPSIRKYYINLRALQQISWANNYPTNWTPTTTHLIQQVDANLLAIFHDRSIPCSEICDAWHAFCLWEEENVNQLQKDYDVLEPLVLHNWPNDPYAYLLIGETNLRLAWGYRGPGYAGNVTPEGWKLMEQHLMIANEALTNAWRLNPGDVRIADCMLSVTLGQGSGKDQLNYWFQQAMALDPNDYAACTCRVRYESPEWYGSKREALDFGRECATNRAWGGRVPLILLDAHDLIRVDPNSTIDQTNYWKQPGVWEDIKLSFDRFFQLNPGETYRYSQYAYYAYQCGQWQQFLDLIQKSNPIDYSYFDSKEEFDRMVQTAKENLAGPSPSDQK